MKKSKKCKSCGITKPLTTEYFHRHNGCIGGFNPRCKECVNAENRQAYANKKIGTVEKEELVIEKVDKKEVEKYERIFNRAIKKELKNRDYGIGKTLKNINYILGKTYIVKSSSKKAPDSFKGKLIQQTQDYIVLEGRYRQCCMKKDFLIGEYEIKEVSI